MPLSDTLLSIVAFRLAVAVLIGGVGYVLPARSSHASHHAVPSIPAVVASPLPSSVRAEATISTPA